MKYALVIDGIARTISKVPVWSVAPQEAVEEIAETDADGETIILQPARAAVVGVIADGWQEVEDDVFAGYVRSDDGTWSAPPAPAPSADELKAYLASIRFDAETGGLVVDTMEIATDRDSQGKILAARVKAGAEAGFSTTWKALNGWFALDAAAIVALSDAVLAHVAACFAAEETVSAAIKAGDVTTREAVDAAFEAARGG
ncbi:uncharacterized protein DUF4376 [Breoghania corrubedonensis]|uniref:Uncharacterized protein DUF4376 n=1 Tax=Breoghania corrubedonensis TaxID=665038 RepID=A0A2T5VE55_9HYPH|nr:DUF4376 domain-containing protein [Breoghania corrubedonensis]PTW62042.1 uncharacterized protein DUF4376 [Breoghania corrubedonensis]